MGGIELSLLLGYRMLNLCRMIRSNPIVVVISLNIYVHSHRLSNVFEPTVYFPCVLHCNARHMVRGWTPVEYVESIRIFAYLFESVKLTNWKFFWIYTNLHNCFSIQYIWAEGTIQNTCVSSILYRKIFHQLIYWAQLLVVLKSENFINNFM